MRLPVASSVYIQQFEFFAGYSGVVQEHLCFSTNQLIYVEYCPLKISQNYEYSSCNKAPSIQHASLPGPSEMSPTCNLGFYAGPGFSQLCYLLHFLGIVLIIVELTRCLD